MGLKLWSTRIVCHSGMFPMVSKEFHMTFMRDRMSLVASLITDMSVDWMEQRGCLTLPCLCGLAGRFLKLKLI